MLNNKDFEICVKALEEKENTKDEELVIKKLKLIIEANTIKEDSEEKMMEIQNKLRDIYEEEQKGNK